MEDGSRNFSPKESEEEENYEETSVNSKLHAIQGKLEALSSSYERNTSQWSILDTCLNRRRLNIVKHIRERNVFVEYEKVRQYAVGKCDDTQIGEADAIQNQMEPILSIIAEHAGDIYAFHKDYLNEFKKIMNELKDLIDEESLDMALKAEDAEDLCAPVFLALFDDMGQALMFINSYFDAFLKALGY